MTHVTVYDPFKNTLLFQSDSCWEAVLLLPLESILGIIRMVIDRDERSLWEHNEKVYDGGRNQRWQAAQTAWQDCAAYQCVPRITARVRRQTYCTQQLTLYNRNNWVTADGLDQKVREGNGSRAQFAVNSWTCFF